MTIQEIATMLPSHIGKDGMLFTKSIIYKEFEIIVDYLSNDNEALFSFSIENNIDAECALRTLHINKFHIYNNEMENLNYTELERLLAYEDYN